MASRKGASGGYHGDLSIPGYVPKTPTKAPPKKWAAKGPAGTYAGAQQEYEAAVTALPAAAETVTRTATREATQKRQRRARKASQRKKALALLKPKPKVKAKAPKPYKAPKLTPEERKITKAIENAKPIKTPKAEAPKPQKAAPQVRQQPQRKGADPAVAVMSSVPGKGPQVTRQRKQAARKELRQAKKAVRRTRPPLKGLSPEEKAVVPLARKAHRKYPDVPASTLMSLTRQESGFDPAAVSSANAQGLTQFIPSTAASYGVKYGTGPKEKQSQVTGAAKLLTDSNFAENPKEALTRYTGGYSDAEYNNPVLEGAADYAAVDKAGSPKAVKRYRRAVKEAKSLGMKVGKPAADLAPAGKYVKVRADAKGMVDWVESALGEVEGSPKTMRWGARTGLNPVTQPWCASFVSNGLLRRGITNLPSNPNYVPTFESEWAQYNVGNDLSQAKPGDLLTFSGQHIGVYIGNGEMISGNSSDAVSRTPATHSGGLSMILRPPYKGGFVKVEEGAALPGSVAVTGSVSASSAPAGVGLVAAPSTGGGKKEKANLTPLQKFNQTTKQLRNLGVGESSTTTSQSSAVLDELEKKYAAA